MADVKNRNPWGKAKKGIWEGAWSDGSKEWTAEVQEELGHNFGGDSVFWISYDDLLRKYQHFDRTRLFRDPDWRCSQRWIGVDVPWKPQFNEKFQIKLTRESPMVLVLSQLDNRYFKGLHGQYRFRLHFRLHERDRPGAEDYIVRSHGNYLMDRSVSIELPSMLPGEYSVFMSIVGERDTGVSSIEEVVKRECKKRVENEKFAQVGYAYDLAHSKATAHLEAVAALRKKSDQKKASDSRKKERHRLWEKRHVTREINKKQGRKNNKKLEEKNAAREEKRKREEDLKPKDVGVQTEEKQEEEKQEEEKKPEGEKSEEAKPDAGKDDSQKADDAETKDKDKDEEEAKDDDETPEGTPIHTPAVSPLEEKTEEEASGEKTETEEKSGEKADGEAAEAKSGEKAEGEAVEEKPGEKADGEAVEEKSGEKTEGEAVEEKPGEKAEVQGSGDAVSSVSSDTSGSPKDTPKSEDSTPATDEKNKAKVPVPPADVSTVSGAPPPVSTTKTVSTTTTTPSTTSKTATKAGTRTTTAKKGPNMYVTSDGESSASPIEDWEELYSSDNMTRKPRMPQPPPPPGTVLQSKYGDETEDENEPDPWNAICIVGVRVYSKDEDLELRVVMEGGALEEGGMGEKGEADLDNAQANAGGQRGRKEKEDETPKDEGGYEGDSEVEEKQKKKGSD